MKLLALDGASRAASAALLSDGALVAESFVENTLTHSQMLLPMVEQTLERAGAAVQEVDAIAVVTGPGSFTGVRIAVSTAKGLGHALNIPIIQVEALAALCHNLPGFAGIMAPMLDARRDQVYAAAYCWRDGQLEELLPGRAMALDSFISELTSIGDDVMFIGDGAAIHREELLAVDGLDAKLAPAHLSSIRAGSVAHLGWQLYQAGTHHQAHDIKALYYRAPQAERALSGEADGA